TPLHLAARNGHLKCLKILVDAGADTEIRSSQGQTAREIAIAEGKYECANFLRTVEALYGCFLFFYLLFSAYRAAYGGFFEITKLLLEHGADGSPNTFSGMTPLYGACLKHHADVVWLLAKTMPHHVNTATKMEKMTPLHVAAGEGNAIIIRILLQTPGKADINAQSIMGRTALHDSITVGQIEIVRLLLDKGADVN
ncbi:predicted protein, partial [Nematostella vectensis]